MLIRCLLLRSAESGPTITYTLLVLILRRSATTFLIGTGILELSGSQRHVRLISLLRGRQRTKESREKLEADTPDEAELAWMKMMLFIESLSLNLIGAGAAVYLVVTPGADPLRAVNRWIVRSTLHRRTQ